jgi:hypothetical protein
VNKDKKANRKVGFFIAHHPPFTPGLQPGFVQVAENRVEKNKEKKCQN